MKIRQCKDVEFANEVRRQLQENDGYCPCAIIKDESTKCMCKDFKDKIDNGYIGECVCGLYEVIE